MPGAARAVRSALPLATNGTQELVLDGRVVTGKDKVNETNP